jgi:hypothetical protein
MPGNASRTSAMLIRLMLVSCSKLRVCRSNSPANGSASITTVGTEVAEPARSKPATDA